VVLGERLHRMRLAAIDEGLVLEHDRPEELVAMKPPRPGERAKRLGGVSELLDANLGGEVELAVMSRLAKGSVAKDTRAALTTQGRGPVETFVKRGDDPPARIVCSASGCQAR
jgi:hypothetical protein